jgi:predicted DCC family thiol-disulfide oxidoreductase YuxK
MGAVDGTQSPEHVVLYDGTCGFCHRVVQWIAASDPRGRFHFAPLQGPTAAALRTRPPELPAGLDSVVYVDRSGGGERLFVRARAIVRIAGRLEPAPAWASWLRLVPGPLLDLGYRAFAPFRHRLYRAESACPLPSPALQARLLP